MDDFISKSGFRLMDNFHEEVVKKRKTVLDSIAYFLSYIGMIVLGLIALLILINALPLLLAGQIGVTIGPITVAIISGVLAYLFYVIRNNNSIEYEYTFTNGELDIAAVIMNNKRKKILSANVKEFESIAPVGDESYRRLVNNMKDYKLYKAYRNNDSGSLYYGLFDHNGVKSLILFEPSEKLLNMFKTYVPRNVKIK